MKVIALEEHCATPTWVNGPGRKLMEHARTLNGVTAHVVDALCEVGEKRIAAMDAAGIDMQVISLTSPGVEQLGAAEAKAIATEANDFMAAGARRYPKRLAAFAALPMVDPVAAAAELDRCVQELGFQGALINGHINGRYLDDPFFSPVFARAEALGVPVYLHPTLPPAAIIDTWFKGFSPQLTNLLARGAWGWHIDTAAHVIRLIAGGVFDRFPRLQLIIGHLGESLSFMMLRPHLDSHMSPAMTKLERPFSAYLCENVSYTFSGFNFTPAFLDLLLEVGAERIMFSTDYPFASTQEARQFLDQLPVSPADKERIAHGNAARLMKSLGD